MNVLRKLAAWSHTFVASIMRVQPGARIVELFTLRDVFWIGGLSAVGYGIAQVYLPAAWIVCGAVVFWMGIRK